MEQSEQIGEIILPRLYERDIDVVLQEELLFNSAVVGLFVEVLGLPRPVTVRRCELSVIKINGETDVLVSVLGANKNFGILIENKIDASFQERQPERYRERCELLIKNGHYDEAHSVLVAPKRYADSKKEESKNFDEIVFYEDIAAAIRLENTSRSSRRADLLLRAVEQARSAYTLTPVAEIGELWLRIYAIASSKFPALQMKHPGEKGLGSHWVLFKADLPPRITIDWKIKQGTVDLSFWKGAPHYPNGNVDLTGAATRHRIYPSE